MLNQFRAISRNFIVRILLGLLALTFIIWGADSRSGNQSYLVQIDKHHHIYIEDFKRTKNNFMQNMGSNVSGYEKSQINQFILNHLIQTKLLELEAQKLGIVVSENVIIDMIKKQKMFANKDSNFDKDLFLKFIAFSGFTEAEYVERMKKEVAISMLTSAFPGYGPSDAVIAKFYQHTLQQRKIDLYTIKLEKNAVYAPSDKEIIDYYNAHAESFVEPESRDVEYVVIQSHSNNQQVKDIEDLAAGGEKLSNIAQKYNLKYQKVSGLYETSKALDANVIKELFALMEGETSDLIRSDANEYYLVNVAKVHKSAQLPLDGKVKAKVITQLQDANRGDLLRKTAVGIYQQIIMGKKDISAIMLENPNIISKQPSQLGRPYGDVRSPIHGDVFNLAKPGEFTNIYKATDDSYQFAQLKGIVNTDNKISKEDANSINTQMLNYTNTMVEESFINYLYSQHQIQVQSKMLDSL